MAFRARQAVVIGVGRKLVGVGRGALVVGNGYVPGPRRDGFHAVVLVAGKASLRGHLRGAQLGRRGFASVLFVDGRQSVLVVMTIGAQGSCGCVRLGQAAGGFRRCRLGSVANGAVGIGRPGQVARAFRRGLPLGRGWVVPAASGAFACGAQAVKAIIDPATQSPRARRARWLVRRPLLMWESSMFPSLLSRGCYETRRKGNAKLPRK